MDKDKAIRSAKLTAAGILDKARARTAVIRAGGQIAPSKYLPNVPRQVHADGGKVAFMQGNHSLVPDVLYHGTARDIQSFDPDAKRSYDVDPSNPEETDTGWFGKGHYFTANPRVASHYAKEGAKRQGDQGANIIPAHVSLKNPFLVDIKAYNSGATELDKALSRAGVPMHPRGWRKPSEQTAALIGMGHDGVIATREGKPEEYVAFHPTQIKSAIGNQGTFDPNDPDITKSEGGAATAPMFQGIHPDLQGEGGAPIDLYHGTTQPKEFEAFDNSKLGARDAGFYGRGHYLTADKVGAEEYANSGDTDGTVIGPLHTALKNPYVWDVSSDTKAHSTLRDLQSMGIMREKNNLDPWDNLQRHHIEPFMAEMRKRGHDGVLVKTDNESVPNGISEVVAFNPNTIKHKDAEVFDPNDPRIRREDGGSVTDTDEFRNWFGNSVTHTNGDPHVFYTGTSKDKDFTSFNVGRHGAWFTRDPALASQYAEQNDSQGYKQDGWKLTPINTASRVIPAYVKAENPYTGDLPDEVLRSNYKAAQSDWFDTLRRKGHDAWIPARHNGDLVVALREPQQIKSIFNNGKFDPKQKHMNKAGGGEVEQMEQPANGMHMLRMRRAGINTKEDFWNRWRDHMRAKAAPNLNLSAIGSKDSHFQQIDNLLNFHRQAADESGIRGVLQRYGQNGQNKDGSMAASMPKAILQGAGIEPTVDNASQIYHSLPDDESGRVGKAGGGEMDGVESNNQNGVSNVGTQNETGIAPFNPAPRAQAGELPNAGRVRGGIGVLQAQNEAPLEGLLSPVTIPMTGQVIHAGPDPRVRQVARDYMASTGLPYNPPKKYAKADPTRALRISDAYEAMEDNSSDPLTKASYAAMIKETMAQYHAAKAAGFKAEFWDPQTQEDPYHASPRLATEDIRNNHHMFVYPTDSGYGSDGPITEEQIKNNPMLQSSGETWNGIPVTVNDIFRAVHDYFGHAKEGVGFRADGEENAWRSHAAMYSPLARMAMTSETRGQNSWLNFNPVSGEKNRKARTENSTFADQKVGVLPHWVHHEGAEDFMGPEEVNAMAAIRKIHGRATGGLVDDDNPAPVIQNPMSIFPKPQRMFPEDQRPKGGQYISTHNKADVTGHKAEAATIGIGPNGKPFFNASQNAVDQTGTVGKGSATTKTNLFKQKAGWKWQDAPEGHENTETIVSVEHRGKHFYALNAHFPKGVDLARYENATSEPRLRPTTQGNVTLGPQAGSISVRGKMHPVYHHVIVKADGGAVDAALALTRRFTKDGKAATMALKTKGK